MANETGNSGAMSCLYSSLVAHHLHQDRMIWSTIQWVLAIQAAVLGGMYAVSRTENILYVPLLGLCGLFVTVAVLFFVRKTVADARVNEALMESLQKLLIDFSGLNHHSCRVKMTQDNMKPTGRTIIYSLLFAFALMDCILIPVMLTW